MKLSLFVGPLPAKPLPRVSGFSLIEIVIALSITVFAILSILGLLGGALHVNRESEQRIEAANLATKLIAQYREASIQKATGTSAWPEDLPIPANADAASSPPGFSAPVAISIRGSKAGGLTDPSAAYALSYIVWKSPSASGGAAVPTYDLVNCTLRFQWPVKALAKASNTQVSNFDITTSFLKTNLP
jgi:type II secretory pathway pseudopilin PulG